MPKQMQVKTYGYKYVADEHRAIFFRLMIEWDNAPNTLSAFYTVDVLQMKHTEAKEVYV